MRRVLVLPSLLLLAACVPGTPVIDSAPVEHVESFYGERTPGTWIVLIDSSALTKTVTLTGASCSQTDAYPLDIRPAFDKSVMDTFRPLADDVRGPLPNGELPRGTTGVIHVRADAIRLTTKDVPNFLGYAFATTLEIDMSFFVDGPHGRLISLKSTGTGESQGNSGVLCEAGGPIFAAAARNAIHDGLTRFAMEFVSSRGVHDAYDAQRTVVSSAPMGQRD